MTGSVDVIWAEGLLDLKVAEKLLLSLGVAIPRIANNTGGRDAFWKSLRKMHGAARAGSLVFALADHDSVKCVGPALATRLVAAKVTKHDQLVLRLAVAEIEAWLLADREALARFLRTRVGLFPDAPDTLIDPKRELVNLARQSTRPEVIAGLAPPQGMSGPVGREYTTYMAEFVQNHWDPRRAERRSPSLQRAIRALRAATSR